MRCLQWNKPLIFLESVSAVPNPIPSQNRRSGSQARTQYITHIAKAANMPRCQLILLSNHMSYKADWMLSKYAFFLLARNNKHTSVLISSVIFW